MRGGSRAGARRRRRREGAVQEGWGLEGEEEGGGVSLARLHTGPYIGCSNPTTSPLLGPRFLIVTRTPALMKTHIIAAACLLHSSLALPPAFSLTMRRRQDLAAEPRKGATPLPRLLHARGTQRRFGPATSPPPPRSIHARSARGHPGPVASHPPPSLPIRGKLRWRAGAEHLCSS